MANERKTRDCPYCKEEIRVDAVKCKHCGSSVAPEKPAHEGTCPYCKEQIHVEAIKCKHCKSDLRSPGNSEGGCGGYSGAYLTPTPVSAPPGSALQLAAPVLHSVLLDPRLRIWCAEWGTCKSPPGIKPPYYPCCIRYRLIVIGDLR